MKLKKLTAMLAAAAITVAGTLHLAAADAARDMSTVTAASLVDKMTPGWNLGNSLDSVGNDETSFGNPVVTPKMIDAVKAAGFKTVRIPVTWMGHFDEGTYAIDQQWIARVKEIVDYVVDRDMYAIINIHHDGNDTDYSWLTPEPADTAAEDAMVDKFKTLWEQIADYFKDYDEHLLFAGMNEFHHGYNNPSDDYLRITDRLNQTFVSTVREASGNNADRILIVQAYNTNSQHALKMQVPSDTASGKLMTEVHYYDPWSFAGEGKGDWGEAGTDTDSWGQEDYVESTFDNLKRKFSDNGIPVILGEFGATKNSDDNADFRRYYVEYVVKAAKAHGFIPVWWDNGYDGDNGEAFALFNRTNYSVIHKDIVDAIMRGAKGDDYKIRLPGETEEPDVTQSETSVPDATESETTKPEATESDTTEPDATESDTAEPDATQSDAAETEATESDAAEPDVTESDTAETEATESDTAETEATESDTAETDATESDTAETEATVSDDASANETTPGADVNPDDDKNQPTGLIFTIIPAAAAAAGAAVAKKKK